MATHPGRLLAIALAMLAVACIAAQDNQVNPEPNPIMPRGGGNSARDHEVFDVSSKHKGTGEQLQEPAEGTDHHGKHDDHGSGSGSKHGKHHGKHNQEQAEGKDHQGNGKHHHGKHHDKPCTHCKHHGKHHGKHHHHNSNGQDPDCYQKEDGLWCPQEDGTWIRDDGEVWVPDHHYGKHHKMQRLCRLQLVGWILGALLLLAGLIWGFFERRRRRLSDSPTSRDGSFISSLCECFRRPSLCVPACLFTPVLAAFNRAKVDERECNLCDVCFALVKPVAQYTTRQSIRGKYGIADDNCGDFLTACCCTPCGVAQDALELERRATVPNGPTDAPPGMLPAYVVAASVPPPAAEVVMSPVSSKFDKVDEQV